MTLPYRVSTPRIAVIISFGTPYLASALSKESKLSSIKRLPLAILLASRNKFLYLSHVQVNSAGFEIDLIILGCFSAI